MTRQRFIQAFVFISLLGFFGGAGQSRALAAEPRLIGVHGDWSAYTYDENGQKVCFMSSQPQKSEGKYSRRGEVFAFITHRPSEGSKNVVSVSAGYTYKTGSESTARVNGKTFSLFTQGEMAWTRDSQSDNALTEAIKKGNSLVVQGTSSRGTLTTDTFSLKGSGAAHSAISKACGV